MRKTAVFFLSLLFPFTGLLEAQDIRLNDPNYPIQQIRIALDYDQKRRSQDVIEILEPLLRHRIFKAPEPKRTADGGQVNVQSYAFFRDLAYVLLSRAHYETGGDRKALVYLTGFPEDSPFYQVAQVQYGWSLLRLGEFQKAEEHLKNLKSRFDSDEIRLQRAFLAVKQGRREEAESMAGRLAFQPSSYLEDLRLKILGQMLFHRYQASLQKPFEYKHELINQTIAVSEKVSSAARDSEFAYFLGEIYWHKASLLRVEDPDRFRKDVHAHLQKADSALRPWVIKSIKEKKPFLTEEAFFLSSVVLWEQNKFKEAVPYLIATTELFPQTIYREDIYQLVGDFYYDTGEFKKALDYYRRLASSGREQKITYGVYKAAWAFYNLSEKFTALRHLQRLVRYHRQKKGESDGNLKVESENDMLLLLAELLPFNEALNEIEIYDYSGEEWYAIREKLAKTYAKIGRFDDGISIYKLLLEKSPRHTRAETWLEELLHNHLNAGQRSAIARSLDKYKNVEKPPLPGSALEKKIIWLQLTLHKEGTKTDDDNIWAAADDLYAVVSTYLPSLASGDFWYFGAQRLEKRGKRWDAIVWYKKSAAVSDYENGADAALSAMRIAQYIIEEESLKKTVDTSVHRRLATEAKWFLDRYEKLEQRFVVERLYLESLFKSGSFKEAQAYLTAAFQKGVAPQTWANYLLYNRYLYDGKRWQTSFELADALSKISRVEEEKKKALDAFLQETAFQFAFTSETTDTVASRQWYLKSVQVGRDQKLQLKSWHNLLLSYKPDSESEDIIKAYDLFKKWREKNLNGELVYDDHRMLEKIHRQAASAYWQSARLDSYWDAVLAAATHMDDEEARELSRWEVLIGSGSWYDKKRFLKEWEKHRTSAYLKEEERRLTLVRIFDLLGMHQEAWGLLKPQLESHAKVAHWIRLRDLLVHSAKDSKSVYHDIEKWIAERKETTVGKEPLKLFWAKRFLGELSDKFRERTPAGATTKSDDPLEQLKSKLNQVTAVLKNMTQHKAGLKEYYDTKIQQVVVEGLCRAPEMTQTAISELNELSRTPVASPQWPQFMVKLEEKVAELKGVKAKEEKICHEKKEEIALFDSVAPTSPALCLKSGCIRPRDLDRRDLERWLKENQVSGLERVWALIKLGALATAEFEAAALVKEGERAMAQALLRLAEDDRAPAAAIMQEIKDNEFQMLISVLLSRIRTANGVPTKPPADASTKLKGWQKEFTD